jgi:P27 family predicted phage terminase small subunit
MAGNKQSGRKPKPKVLKELAGTFRADQHNADSPEVAAYATPPRVPKHITDDRVKAEWRKTAKLLTFMGVLTEADLGALEVYCTVSARWRHAEEQLQRYGVMLVGDNQTFRTSPYLRIAEDALKNMRQWMNEFGITPASRTRVSANKRVVQQIESEDWFGIQNRN